jgi:hypothetical protein
MSSWEQLIREKAYELWVQRGRPAGGDLRDWLDAEKLLAGRDLPCGLKELGETAETVRRGVQPAL